MPITTFPNSNCKPFITIRIPPIGALYQTSMSHVLRTSGYSQALRKRLRTEGLFLVNGQVAKWQTPLYGGEFLECFLHIGHHFEPFELPLDILYEDEFLVVVNKPAGLLMHPTAKERVKTLANALLYYYNVTKQSATFHPVHRLDKNTSGLVIIAKNPSVQHRFSQEKMRIKKYYTAICEGYYPAEYSSIRFPIQRKPESIVERECSIDGKRAHTDIHRIQGNPLGSLLNVALFTGRTHQIRVHCATMGHPLHGDLLYGGHSHAEDHQDNNDGRQALHASRLLFIHPISKQSLTISAPLPKDLLHLAQKLHLI